MKFVFTPAFCKASMLRDCMEHLYATQPMDEYEHIIVDNHYPVQKAINREYIRELCRKYGATYVDSGGDLGLHGGVNYAMRLVGVKSDDFYVGCDPDDRPSTGALKAIFDVMEADPKVAVCALNFFVIPWKMKDHGLVMQEEVIAGHNVWVHPGVEMWNVAGFNMPLVHKLGGFWQPNAFYGGIEVALYHQWSKEGMKLVYLKDFNSEDKPVDRNNPELYDQTYGQWKIDHATKGFKESFEIWLKCQTGGDGA